MNKAQLIDAIAKENDISRACAARCVDSVLGAIRKGLKKDRSVAIAGFGSFVVKKRAARWGRNPQTGERIKIKASKTVGFKPGSPLKASV